MKLGMVTGILALAGVVMISGCRTPQGRIMGEEEQDYVGAKTAGSATFDRLIEETVTKLLNRQSAAQRALGQLKVAFLGVENKSIEDLGDFQEQIYEQIDTSINNSNRYRTVSDRFVNAALRDTRLRAEELFLPKQRREFIQTLEASGNPVEFLLFAKLTSGTTRGDDVKQRAYMLTLELVDVETGFNDKESTRVRKAYTK
ncbi:MAG: penicillin-binding protein activator LpoB [Planctomycetes bacterium]|nr:penicillin-binding protein activator LpoB [Planctomycetota bacterium]